MLNPAKNFQGQKLWDSIQIILHLLKLKFYESHNTYYKSNDSKV